MFSAFVKRASAIRLRHVAASFLILLLAAVLFFHRALQHVDRLTHNALFYVLILAALAAALYGIAKPIMDYSAALAAFGEPSDGPHYRSELNKRHDLADQYKRENLWKSELLLALFVVLLVAIAVLNGD